MQRIERHTEVRHRKQRKHRSGKNLLRIETNSSAVVIHDDGTDERKNKVMESWKRMEEGNRKRGQDRRNIVS